MSRQPLLLLLCVFPACASVSTGEAASVAGVDGKSAEGVTDASSEVASATVADIQSDVGIGGIDVFDTADGMDAEEGCKPGSTVCKDLGSAWVCTEHGNWISFPCVEDAVCDDGVCVFCAPDEIECLTFTSYKTCAPDRRAWGGYEVCEPGLNCVDGACRDCQISQQCDSAGSVETACVEDSGESIWSESLPCQEDQICTNATCIYAGCLPSVILVIDRSSSMEYHWYSVRNSVAKLVTDNPGVRFGLYAFPGLLSCVVPSELQVPFTQGDPTPFTDWFDSWGILMSTPLYDAIVALEWVAPEALGGTGGAMVVVADGEDTCSFDFPGAISGLLAQSSERLHLIYDIQTYVIGYDFGSPLTPMDGQEQLNALAAHGGTTYDTYIPAGNEEELNEAFSDITVDWKLCLGEQ